jgi:hypothetical protein
VINTAKRSRLIVATIITAAMVLAADRLVDYYWFISNDTGDGPLPIRPAGLMKWRIFYTWALVS